MYYQSTNENTIQGLPTIDIYVYIHIMIEKLSYRMLVDYSRYCIENIDSVYPLLYIGKIKIVTLTLYSQVMVKL